MKKIIVFLIEFFFGFMLGEHRCMPDPIRARKATREWLVACDLASDLEAADYLLKTAQVTLNGQGFMNMYYSLLPGDILGTTKGNYEYQIPEDPEPGVVIKKPKKIPVHSLGGK